MRYPPAIPTIEEIFREYKSRIYRLGLSITRNTADAQDILQNTLIKVANSLKGFRGDSTLSTWIYKIAYNEALMLLRKRGRNARLSSYLFHQAKKIPSGLFINWPKAPDEILLDSELKNRLDSAIKHMPIQYRMPLFLHHIEDMPVKETAEILGLKLNSLKTRLHRAYLILRKEMSEYMKDREPEETEKVAKCSILAKFVYDYERGVLGEKKRLSFDSHLSGCQSCRQFLDGYRKAIRLSSALQCQDIPPELQSKIKTFLHIS